MRFIGGTHFFPISDNQPGLVRSYAEPDVFYHDIVASYDFGKVLLTGGIDNLFDRSPPFVPGYAVNADFDQYDDLGRLFYLKLQANF